VTSDLFCRYAGERIFRLNFDRLAEYRLCLSREGFRISDPIGREATLEGLNSIYWRKPLLAESPPRTDYLAHFEYKQRLAFLRDLMNVCEHAGLWTLIDHLCQDRCTKALQMRVAARYFPVPSWRMAIPHANYGVSPKLAKPLTTAWVAEGKVMTSSRIPCEAVLSPGHLWFTQEEVQATHDVTVVWCCGRSWAWSLERTFLAQTPDWRVAPNVVDDYSKWKKIELPDATISAISAIVKELGIDYGRFDFLLDESGTFHFLEVNPNGQYAWLDLDGSVGMLTWVFDCALACPSGYSRHRLC
jgi:hypothetical protein